MSLRDMRTASSLHFTAPNPKLDLEATPFRVVTSLQPWQSPRVRRAAPASARSASEGRMPTWFWRRLLSPARPGPTTTSS